MKKCTSFISLLFELQGDGIVNGAEGSVNMHAGSTNGCICF